MFGGVWDAVAAGNAALAAPQHTRDLASVLAC